MSTEERFGASFGRNEAGLRVEVYNEEGDLLPVTDEVKIIPRGRVFTDSNERNLQGATIYDVELPGVSKCPRFALIHKDPERTGIPGWLRQEISRGNHGWRQIHRLCRRTKLWAGPYFNPLDEIRRVEGRDYAEGEELCSSKDRVETGDSHGAYAES
jgi:hypothetical protein